MNKTLKRLTLISAALLIGLLLITLTTGVTWAQGPGSGYPPGGYGWGHGPGWMDNGQSPGMPGRPWGQGPGMMGRGRGPGMMGGRGYGYGPQQGITGAVPYGYGPGQCPGMGGGWGYGYAPQNEPISAEQAVTAVETYLANYNNPDLVIAEVMSFSQNFYAQVKEASSGRMAFELLVDPYTGLVGPEPGPNMMWNTRYGHMAGRWGANTQDTAEMPVTAAQATQLAQDFLDTTWPGATAADHVDTFYGYYTLHVLQAEKIVGMLSVNGFSGQVWYHTWHGDFMGMVGDEE